jgi:PRTRC genetic system protein E
MLFTNIAALIAMGVTLQITVSKADGNKLEVGLIPTTETGKSGMSLIAQSFVGTPSELDTEFATIIAGYASANQTLMGQLQAVQTMADAAAKEASEAAATKAAEKKVARPTTTATKTLPGKSPAKVTPSLDDDDDEDQPDPEDRGSAATLAVGQSDAASTSAGQSNQIPFEL